MLRPVTQTKAHFGFSGEEEHIPRGDVPRMFPKDESREMKLLQPLSGECLDFPLRHKLYMFEIKSHMQNISAGNREPLVRMTVGDPRSKVSSCAIADCGTCLFLGRRKTLLDVCRPRNRDVRAIDTIIDEEIVQIVTNKSHEKPSPVQTVPNLPPIFKRKTFVWI